MYTTPGFLSKKISKQYSKVEYQVFDMRETSGKPGFLSRVSLTSLLWVRPSMFAAKCSRDSPKPQETTQAWWSTHFYWDNWGWVLLISCIRTIETTRRVSDYVQIGLMLSTFLGYWRDFWVWRTCQLDPFCRSSVGESVLEKEGFTLDPGLENFAELWGIMMSLIVPRATGYIHPIPIQTLEESIYTLVHLANPTCILLCSGVVFRY